MDLSDAQRRILQALRDGPLQTKDVASALGVEASSVHRHLVRLKAARMVEAEDVIDGPGRPKRLYHLTVTGQESFPRDYAFLLGAVLRQIELRGGREALVGVLQGISDELAAPLTEVSDLDARLARLVALYNDLGFEASLEVSGPDLILIQRNCPFLKTARDDPRSMCESLDEGIIRRALPDADVRLDRTLARNDNYCRHIIRRTIGGSSFA